jgi:iron(III) transport system permease protein
VTRWRLAVAAVLLLLVGLPLGLPLAAYLANLDSWRAWADTDRMLGLARNTFQLVAGTLALSLPLGVTGAALLYRTDLPGRRFFRFLTVLTLFVPLPLFTSGWQTVLGSGGWLPSALWNPPRAGDPGITAPTGNVWTPWGQGIGSAVWVHALAGLPWVVLLVGQGLCWVERELEEDHLLAEPAWRVLLRVSLPRSAAAVAAAALWVALQTAGEITVTDVMQVRTFAEEVYAQFTAPQVGASTARGDMVARAVVVALPLVLLVALLIVGMAWRWERSLPPRLGMAEPLVFPLGRLRWPAWALTAAVSAVLLGVPMGSLVWRAGLSGAPPAWSWTTTCQSLARVWRAEGARALDSLMVGGASGVFCAALALVACWAALGARTFRVAVLVLMAVAWALPGPVIGLTLKDAIRRPLELAGWPTLPARWLWNGPSVLPVLWVDVIRFFPCAVAVLWPVVRLLPRELRDAARVDGMPPAGELRHVVWPLASAACLQAALAVAVLSLGELSGGKLVSTPGRPSYAEVIFTQMHFGVTNDLAARCLVLLVLVGLGAALVALLGRRRTEPPT